MKNTHFTIGCLCFIILIVILVLFGAYGIGQLDEEHPSINDTQDIINFLEDCNKKFMLNCDALLIERLGEIQR